MVGLCLKVQPTQRISANDLLAHPFVIRNMPASEILSQNNSQTSKCSLLKTIMVPKNLKSLKEALPASKYDKPAKVPEVNKFRRANSANQLRSDLPQVIESPKGEHNPQIKYALMKRPSQEPKREMHSERQDQPRPVSRMERNNSLDYIRKRVESNKSIESSRRSVSSRKIVRPCQERPSR